MGTPVPGTADFDTPVPAVPTPVPVSHSGSLGPSAPDLVGTILADRYRILRKLGEGGMGSVYLAEHTTINKRLAIKVLSSEYCHKQDLVNRFLQEARAASMIEQENVVEITDFGSTPGGSVFFAMEYLNGEDLAATIKREGALSWTRARQILLQICAALGSAHAAGIIHRDMKPDNCYRIRRGSNDDFIKVLDFGIAKVQSDEGDGGRALTRTGMIFGTPEYMSPEQAKGEKVDHRVDVYAVGVIMYELLTGRVPFTADTFMGILTKHMFEAPQAPSALIGPGSIPVDVEAIILKSLQKDREYRFQTMAEMAHAIEA
ncbi:MAG TPA: serine/threonine-protein kinase, partial [Nannocystaceae bacterium]|nr:serine/threonine-protein kinase [Nannocystaceae bacterium]